MMYATCVTVSIHLIKSKIPRRGTACSYSCLSFTQVGRLIEWTFLTAPLEGEANMTRKFKRAIPINRVCPFRSWYVSEKISSVVGQISIFLRWREAGAILDIQRHERIC